MAKYLVALCIYLASQSVGYALSFYPENEVITEAKKYLYVREESYNQSREIDEWNRYAGVALGSPYCASFVSWVHHQAGLKAPVSAWAPDQVRRNNVPFSSLKSGDVFGIYFQSKKRVAHVGLVDRVKGSYVMTVEANTSPDAVAGSNADRDGQGVYARRRPVYLMKQTGNKFSRYTE
jgi:hypothetical protein